MKIPFVYEMTVMTGAGRTVERTYRETLQVDLRAVEAEAFRPALRIPGRTAHGEDVVREYRSGPNGFYEPLVQGEWTPAGHRSVPITQAALEETLEREAGRPGLKISMFINIPEVLKAAEVKLKGPPKPSTVVYGNDGRASIVKKVRTAADRLLSCEGEIHRSIPEPILVMSRDKPALTMRWTDSPDVEWHLAFRLDDAQEARALAAQVFMTTPAQVEMPEFELLVDDACRARFPYAFGAAILDLLNAAQNALPDLPLPAMAAYCDLAEARNAPMADEEAQFVSAMALIERLEEAEACVSTTRLVRYTLDRVGRAKGLGLSDEDRFALSL